MEKTLHYALGSTCSKKSKHTHTPDEYFPPFASHIAGQVPVNDVQTYRGLESRRPRPSLFHI